MAEIAGLLKAILLGIIAATCMIVFINLAYFFPWYMIIVETASTVSQMIANDNYLTYDNFDLIDTELRKKPIFKERRTEDKLWIKAEHLSEGRRTAIETATQSEMFGLIDYYNMNDTNSKPYVQMGNTVEIIIYANYPFQMDFNGRMITVADIPVTYTVTTTTLKHYKDLDYEYVELNDGDTDEYDPYD